MQCNITHRKMTDIISKFSQLTSGLAVQIKISTANPEAAGAGGKEPAHPAKRHFYTTIFAASPRPAQFAVGECSQVDAVPGN